MRWMILCILSLSNASKSERNKPIGSSISDTVRLGVEMMSRFINAESPHTFSFLFNKLVKEIKMSQREGEGLRPIVLRLMGLEPLQKMNQIFDGYRNGKRKRKEGTEFSLFRFIVSELQIDHLLSQIQDPKFFDMVLKEFEKKLKYYPEENVDCIKALICRTKPFVQKMQRSLRFFINRENIKISGEETYEEISRREDENAAWEKANLEDRMYFFIPSLSEVVKCGDHCDQLFTNCTY